MKILPVSKNSNLILDCFPEDYENMVYIEPYFGIGSVLLNKKPSKEEVINDPDIKIVRNFKVVRDQSTYLIKALNRKTPNKSEIDVAANDLVLKRIKSSQSKKDSLKRAIEETKNLSKRLENVYILNKCPIAVLKAFSSQEVLLFINLSKLQKKEDSMQEQINLAENLKTFKGKITLLCSPSNFYSRFFKGWKANKKSDIWLWMNWK